ncbi:MAG: sugar ABC transporter ATP-binding protein, partial [Planctomycetes bacterium]|nr:sugar ABC transporter ATP-binding protein [Planctomycetota bacterium]
MPESSSTPLLDCRQIGVRYGGVVALEDVDFTLTTGEVHGLVGCNGAGKSTLMKVLAGVVPEYRGDITIDGQSVRLNSPRDAIEQKIAMVYQELSGIGSLSVAENLFLGRQPGVSGCIDWRRMYDEAEISLANLDIHIDVRRRLDRYPLVIRQMVEIARGLRSGARILILDEPTSTLSLPEARRLFDVIGKLKATGVAIVFISHFIEDVLAICDRVTILRDGRRLDTRLATELDRATILHLMVGDSTETSAEERLESQLPATAIGTPAIAVNGLSSDGRFDELSFDVKPGECLGLYGFVGAGHQDVVHSLAGALKPDSGSIHLNQQIVPSGRIDLAVKEGIVMVAADRAQTLVRKAPISHNATMAHLKRVFGNWLTRSAEHRICQPLLQRVGCRPPVPSLKAGALSGGNQQKVVMAKWLLGPMKV